MDLEWLRELMKRAGENLVTNEITDDYTIWNILTALRGPDNVIPNDIANENLRLKELTTARIRGILGITKEDVCIRDQPLTDAEIKERDNLLEKSMHQNLRYQDTHFFLHFSLAISALERLGYDIPDAEKESLISLRDRIIIGIW